MNKANYFKNLYKNKSFIKGFRSIFNLFGNLNKNNYSFDNAGSINSDWSKIRDDFRSNFNY